MNNRNHQKQEKHYIVDILFVLALFGVFAVSALALVTIGADVYQHTVEDMGVNYESRTAVSYIMEKVRQNDTADSIFLTDLEMFRRSACFPKLTKKPTVLTSICMTDI